MSTDDPLIGKQLGDYKIERLLGAGGMARVYLGYDEKLDRHAAVKVGESSLMVGEYEEEFRERFLREARSIARLKHPSIVGVYQFNQVGTLYYMAMELVQGKDLRHILREHARKDWNFPRDQMMMLLRDIAGALDYAHQQGVIHRDVKPSNIMIKDDGHAVLMDFGLALNVPEGTIGNTFGSVHYIAPEQAISSAQAVPQSDLYSLGVVLYEMLTGRVPFDDASAMSVALKHISDPPPAPSEINPNIAPDVEQMVIRSLDKDPNKRYATGAEFVRALETAFALSTRAEKPKVSGQTKPLRLPASRAAKGAAPAGVAVESTTVPDTRTLPLAPEETSPDKTVRPRVERAPRRWIGVGVGVAALILVAAGLLLALKNNQPMVSALAATQTAVAAHAQVVLRYDGRILVLLNRASGSVVDLRDLEFVQAKSNGERLAFRSSGWTTGDLRALRFGGCYQLYTMEYMDLPPEEPPIENCRISSFRQIVDTFWISDDAGATFQVRRGADVLATCPVSLPDLTVEQQCAVDVSRAAPLATIGPSPTAGDTSAPSATESRPSSTPRPSATPVPPTDTPKPSRTPVPTSTSVPPTDTHIPSSSTPRPTNTPQPTDTPTATNTPPPTDTVQPTDTPTPPSTPTEALTAGEGEAQALLVYDGRTLVLFNRSDATLDVSRLTFVQQAASRNISFQSSEWTTGSLTEFRRGRCYQVWSVNYVDLPTDEPPADICAFRSGFGQTSRAFWISRTPDATFEVRRGGDVLAVCPAAIPDTKDQLRCALDVR